MVGDVFTGLSVEEHDDTYIISLKSMPANSSLLKLAQDLKSFWRMHETPCSSVHQYQEVCITWEFLTFQKYVRKNMFFDLAL